MSSAVRIKVFFHGIFEVKSLEYLVVRYLVFVMI
jgi:hypothetical protein